MGYKFYQIDILFAWLFANEDVHMNLQNTNTSFYKTAHRMAIRTLTFDGKNLEPVTRQEYLRTHYECVRVLSELDPAQPSHAALDEQVRGETVSTVLRFYDRSNGRDAERSHTPKHVQVVRFS
jgi:hypothetical protein